MSHADEPGGPDDARVDRIGQLVKLGGRRPMPDPVRMASARAAAREEWARTVARRSWRVSFWTVAGALTTCVLGAAMWLWLRDGAVPTPRVDLAMLQTVTGPVVITDADEEARARVDVGAWLHGGDRIDTADGGRAAFSLNSRISVRVDHGTTLVLDGADRLTLERGAVYIDAPGETPAESLQVQTPFGGVRHLGTQFEVRLHEGALRVRVREGTVAVDGTRERWTSRAGEELFLARGQAPARRAIETFGPEWSWISALAPPFRLEGATVPRFLDWVSRELGMRWEYTDPRIGSRAESTVLHGSLDGLTPEDALGAVLPTAGLAARREKGRILVSEVRTR